MNNEALNKALNELTELRLDKERNLEEFENLANVQEARKMIEIHETEVAKNQEQITGLQNIIATLRKPHDKKDAKIDHLIHAKELEIARMMQADGLEKYDTDGLSARVKVRHFDTINDFNIANQKTLKNDAEVIAKISEYDTDIVKTTQSIDINKLKRAIKDGVFHIVDGRIITQDGETLSIELEKKDEYTLNTKYMEVGR